MVASIMPLLFAIYLLLWITSFVDSGYLKSDNEAKIIYSRIINITMASVVVCLPGLGWLSDKMKPNVMVPLSFLLRCVVCACFVYFINAPDSNWAILLSVLLIICSMVENVCIAALFQRTMPADLRGAMLGTMAFFGQLGQIGFTTTCSALLGSYTTKSPFAVVAIADFTLFFVGAVLGCMGYLKR
jgi:MFS family permease